MGGWAVGESRRWEVAGAGGMAAGSPVSFHALTGSSSGFSGSLGFAAGTLLRLQKAPGMSASGPRPPVWGSHKFRGRAHLCLWGAAQPPLPFVTEQVTELAEQSDPRREGLKGRADPASTTTLRMGVCLVLLWMQLMHLLFFLHLEMRKEGSRPGFAPLLPGNGGHLGAS